MTGYTRRDFLRIAGAAVCVGALGPLAGCGGLPRFRATLQDGRLRITEAEFDFLAGDVHTAVLVSSPTRDGSLILMRLDDGTYRALSAVCTHQGCEVRPSRQLIHCPCHGSAYALDGRVIRGPAQRPLDVYPVDVRNGAIEIEVDP